MKPERLDHLLARLGLCPRRLVRRAVRDGRVEVDGRTPAFDARVDPEQVRWDGAPLLAPDGLVVLLHKPAGTVTTASEAEGPRAIDCVPAAWRRPALQPVGRLDRDTTGALLFTDRGDYNHAWTHPRRHVEKVYVARLDRPADDAVAAAFARGLVLSDGPCRPAPVDVLADGSARVTLTEGRSHQVKRMFEAVGRTVLSLHRERFGPYALDGLPPGACRTVVP
jgi:16S rRNA pseudouridine516 synthase